MLGENFESFEQWKSLLILLCGCREAVVRSQRRDLFYRLVPVLYAQVEQLPEEFFAENNEEGGEGMGSLNNNFISRAMFDLIQTSLEPEVSK